MIFLLYSAELGNFLCIYNVCMYILSIITLHERANAMREGKLQQRVMRARSQEYLYRIMEYIKSLVEIF